MIVRFPKIPQKYMDQFWIQTLDIITQAFRQVNSRRYAQDRVFLQSPNGTVYAVTVDNAGTLSTEVTDGNSLD